MDQNQTNFSRDQIKLINESKRVLGIKNNDIEYRFQFSKDNEEIFEKNIDEKVKQLENNARYLHCQVQPLLDENHKLKETLIQINKYIRKQEEITINLIRRSDPNGISREKNIDCSSLEDLFSYIKEDINYDQMLISQLRKEIEIKEQILKDLDKKIIIQDDEIKKLALQKKIESEQYQKEIKLKEEQFLTQKKEMEKQLSVFEDDQRNKLFQIEKLEKQITFFNTQLLLNKKQYEELQKNLQTQQTKFTLELEQAQIIYNDQMTQMKTEYTNQINEFKFQVTKQEKEHQQVKQDYEEKVEDLIQKLNFEMKRSGYELIQVENDYKQLLKQYDELKNNEIQTLDKLAQLMVNKRTQEQKLEELEQDFNEKTEELREERLRVLQTQKNCDQRLNQMQEQLKSQKKQFDETRAELVQDYEQKIQNIVRKNESDTTLLKINYEEEIKQMEFRHLCQKDEFKKIELNNLHNIEDLKQDIKQQDNAWNFKYVTMEIEMQRRLENIQNSLDDQIQAVKSQAANEIQDIKLEKDQYIRNLEMENQENLKQIFSKHENEFYQLKQDYESQIRQLKIQLSMKTSEYNQLSKSSTEIIQKNDHELSILDSKLKNCIQYCNDQIQTLNKKYNDDMDVVKSQNDKKLKQLEDDCTKRIQNLVKELNRYKDSYYFKVKENDNLQNELNSIIEKRKYLFDKNTQTDLKSEHFDDDEIIKFKNGYKVNSSSSKKDQVYFAQANLGRRSSLFRNSQKSQNESVRGSIKGNTQSSGSSDQRNNLRENNQNKQLNQKEVYSQSPSITSVDKNQQPIQQFEISRKQNSQPNRDKDNRHHEFTIPQSLKDYNSKNDLNQREYTSYSQQQRRIPQVESIMEVPEGVSKPQLSKINISQNDQKQQFSSERQNQKSEHKKNREITDQITISYTADEQPQKNNNIFTHQNTHPQQTVNLIKEDELSQSVDKKQQLLIQNSQNYGQRAQTISSYSSNQMRCVKERYLDRQNPNQQEEFYFNSLSEKNVEIQNFDTQNKVNLSESEGENTSFKIKVAKMKQKSNKEKQQFQKTQQQKDKSLQITPLISQQKRVPKSVDLPQLDGKQNQHKNDRIYQQDANLHVSPEGRNGNQRGSPQNTRERDVMITHSKQQKSSGGYLNQKSPVYNYEEHLDQRISKNKLKAQNTYKISRGNVSRNSNTQRQLVNFSPKSNPSQTIQFIVEGSGKKKAGNLHDKNPGFLDYLQLNSVKTQNCQIEQYSQQIQFENELQDIPFLHIRHFSLITPQT